VTLAAFAVGSLPATAVAATTPVLAVSVVGPGSVSSHPSGITCPGKCSATFAAGTKVVLTARPRGGSGFLRWGGACTGTGQCRVKVTSLVAVAAQFVGGRKTKPLPVNPNSIAEPGMYSGQTSQHLEGGATFFVAPGGASLLNISIPLTNLTCTPGGATHRDQLWISKAAIKPNGSFTATASHSGVWSGGYEATFTYNFDGKFAAGTAKGSGGAAGSYRENVVYNNGSHYSCTSNNQTWTAAKTGPTPARKLVAVSGNYTGQTSQYLEGGVTFSVAPGGASLVNISIPLTNLICTPGGATHRDQLAIAHAAVKSEGSFAATGSQEGAFQGESAKFNYSFAGNFEGLNSRGIPTAAGSYREDIVYSSNGTKYTCTTDDESWIATHS